jgi:EpsD family peptidyl-prolyl cis-trans isomerase
MRPFFSTHHMNHFQRNPIVRLLQTSALALSISAGLSACDKPEPGAETAEVVAQVGTSKISMNQINEVLGDVPMANASPNAVQSARGKVLERLIDRQLAADQATQLKLHTSPEVVAQLEAARLDVLARVYTEQLTTALPAPTPQEVTQYYLDNPALFAERRVFNLQEIRVPKATAVIADLQKMAEQGRSMDDVAGLLRARQVQFGGGSATRPAEQIPLELLPRVHALKDGQSTVIQAGDSVTFLRVDSSQQVPVSEAVAGPDIAKHLRNKRSAAAVSADLKRLREATTVTYLGDFERASGEASQASTKPSTTP